MLHYMMFRIAVDLLKSWKFGIYLLFVCFECAWNFILIFQANLFSVSPSITSPNLTLLSSNIQPALNHQAGRLLKILNQSHELLLYVAHRMPNLVPHLFFWTPFMFLNVKLFTISGSQ